MKQTFKNLLLGCSLLFAATASRAQGLEQITVEPYYEASAADVAASEFGDTDGAITLATGSKTYRIYADLLPGYKLETVYGDLVHALDISTSTYFYNQTDRGTEFGHTNATSRLDENTCSIDSYLTFGNAGSTRRGVLKSADADATATIFPNSEGSPVMENVTAWMGTALTSADGMVVGTALTTQTIGFTSLTAVLNNAVGNDLASDPANGSAWFVLGGAQGEDPNGTNRILIGQFTTNGDFSFHLNMRVSPLAGGSFTDYVWSNPQGAEVSIPSLTYPEAQVVDCNGVPGGPALPGTPCNDNNACTINDVYTGTAPSCGCAGTPGPDTDGDGTCDAIDGCPNDPAKIAPGICGCGTADTDSDADGTADCNDGCPNDPNKTAPGVCGCGTADTDSDSDGTADCNDGCPNDPNKTAPGICGCGVSDTDTDADGTADCNDGCPADPNKIAPGQCGCGVADTDGDSDGVADCVDPCPALANIEPGDPCDDGNVLTIGDVYGANCVCAGTVVGCVGNGDCNDNDDCTSDACVANACVYTPLPDGDGDGTCDAQDGCPADPNKTAPGICGCGVSDADTDGDGTADCNDGCPADPNKIAPGICGCGVADTDTDSDGTADCNDGCPSDPNKIAAGICGCGTADTDTDGDGTADCVDPCPALANVEPGDLCDDGNALTVGDVINANCECIGTPVSCTVAGDCNDQDPCTTDDCVANACVYTPVADTDGDGTCDVIDGCPADANKIAAGICGCGNPEPGASCDDGNAGTVGDQIDANCTCVGTPLGEDCLGVPGGSALPGTACDDLNPLTGGDVWDANCVCAGELIDCLGVPGGTATIGSTCDDGNACTTGDVYDANCVCAGTFQDSDADGVCDANDNCPNVTGQVGSTCDDGNVNTIGDVLNANCQCQGTPVGGCTQNLTLSITLDAFGSETEWTLYDATETGVLDSGGPYSNGTPGTVITEDICVPVGCYHLEVTDGGGNGITGGGYVLRDANSKRIIDASMGSFSSTSEIGGTARTFCVPISNLNLLGNTCDQSSKLIQSPIYCNSQPGSTGIQWWIFDPHGSYNRRVTTPSNVLIPGNLNTNPIPTNTWLNVRVRPVFSGGPGEFGPACRIRFIPNNAGAASRDVLFDEATSATMSLFPNPNRDGQVTLSMAGLDVVDETMVDVDVYDMLGKRVFAERAVAAEGIVNHRMDLSREIGTGLYMVNVTVNGKLYTQRLVIQ